jgi:hypothetical protein
MKPIPTKMLPQSVVYNAYVSNTGEGSSFGTSITLTNVKMEEVKQLSRTNNGIEVIGNAMLFYDCVNSNGLTAKPLNESKITYDSHIYHIISTDILYSEDSTPHHYEILLR